MKSNYSQRTQKTQLSRKAMGDYLIRASVDKQIDKRIEEHKETMWKELMTYAQAVDATVLLASHYIDGKGAKRLRKYWEELIKLRVAYRLFFRDGNDYVEQYTGENAEDEAIVKELLSIGVDIKAWEAEEIKIDEKTGEVTFVKPEEVHND